MIRACGLLLLAAAAGASLRGQAPAAAAATLEVVVELGPDPDGTGPEALVWLRDELVPAAAEWPRGASPRAAVRITFGPAGAFRAVLAPEKALAARELRAEVRDGGRRIATAAGLGDGGETLELEPGADVPAVARELGTLVGSGPALTRDLCLDLPSLLGAFGGQHDCSPGRATLTSLLAAHVGEVRVRWQRRGDATVLHGQSAGGLVVPLALACAGYAELRAARRCALGEEEALAIRALALRTSAREEAARQLARVATPAANEALLRLCRSDEYARVVAMESLARRGDPEALGALVDAATESIPDSVTVAREAMLALWGSASPEQRQSLLACLRSRPEEALRELTGQLEGARVAGTGGAAPAGARTRVREAPSRFWLLLPLALGLVLLWALAGGKGSDPFTPRS